MPSIRLRTASTLAASLAAAFATVEPAFAQLNSYGSGLYNSETLSTPPNRRQGGYWNSTNQNGGTRDRATSSQRQTAPRTSQNGNPQ